MVQYDYDLFVIGAGSGGVRAARQAAATGARVGIAEAGQLGGTCVNRGCVPKKLYYYSSHFHEDFEDAKAYGWSLADPQFSWARLQENKDREIKRLNQVYAELLKKAGVDLFYARARFVDAHSLELKGLGNSSLDKRITTAKILVASGSRPFVPDFPGKEHIHTSDDIFLQKELPRRIVVVGGGYIAVEFAGIFAGLGCAVTLAYPGNLFLRRFDESIRRFFNEELQKKGVELRFQTRVDKITQDAGASLRVFLGDGKHILADQVFYATGRIANTTGIGLEAAGVELNERGNIKVDADFCTSLPSVYALGDVIGRVQLTPVAIAEATHFVRAQFLNERSVPMNYDHIPTAVFSQPSIGSVGLTEEQAKERHLHVRAYESDFQTLRHSLTDRKERMLIKLVVDEDSDRVLGAHLIGAEAGETIQGLAIALKAGANKQLFDATIGVHPTAAEEFVSLR